METEEKKAKEKAKKQVPLRLNAALWNRPCPVGRR